MPDISAITDLTTISALSFPRPTGTVSCAIAPATPLISLATCAKVTLMIVPQVLATMARSAMTS